MPDGTATSRPNIPTAMTTAEFEVWLRYLVEELETVTSSLHLAVNGPDAGLRASLTDLYWKVDSLRRFYDFALARHRDASPSTAAGIQAGEVAHHESGVLFIGAELERARESVADSRRQFLSGDMVGAQTGRDGAARAHDAAGRLLDDAEQRGWETSVLRDRLNALNYQITALPSDGSQSDS